MNQVIWAALDEVDVVFEGGAEVGVELAEEWWEEEEGGALGVSGGVWAAQMGGRGRGREGEGEAGIGAWSGY